MSEAIKCFQFISENAPECISILESLEKKVRERQEHICRVPVPSRKLKKTGSNESIRPHSSGQDASLEIHSCPQNEHMAHPIDPHQFLVNSRKRKTASILSNESVPSKYRTRSMIVVYYDSEIQKSFEQTVRHIGASRNAIRRARMAVRMEAMTSGDPSAVMMNGARTGYAPLALFRTARGPPPRPDPAADWSASPTDAFGIVDATLEKAQSLCERGAHQFLREGDCEAEIVGAKESFEEAKRVSDTELITLKQQEEKKQQTREDHPSPSFSPTTSVAMSSGPIEVDDAMDNGGEEEVIEIPTFRSSRTRRR